MELQNDKQLNTASDSAYGGGKYRLSYDADINKQDEYSGSDKKISKPMRLATWVIFAVIFAIIGIFILSYYNSQVRKIFGNSDDNGEGSSAAEYSNINVVP